MALKKFDPKILPYMVALTTAVMLTRAGVQYFGPWGWIIGPMAGAVASLALAVAGSKISDIAAKRKPMAYTALFLMMLLSPLVIYFSEPNPDVGTIMWAMFPDAAILLASTVTGQALIAKDAPQAAQAGPQVAKVAPKVKGKVARKTVKDDDLVAYLRSNKNASQQDVADHFGVSRQAIGQRVKKLVEQGKL